MSQNITVCCRIRPSFGLSSETCMKIHHGSSSYISVNGGLSFTMDRVFDGNVSQSEIFCDIVEPLLQEALRGLNCTFFTYGQTGSGKNPESSNRSLFRLNIHFLDRENVHDARTGNCRYGRHSSKGRHPITCRE